MSNFFHYLQSGAAQLRLVGAQDQREIDLQDFVSRTVSRPPLDPFNTYVLSETAMAELSHAEDIYMAKEGFVVADVDNDMERFAVDDQFIAGRLNSAVPAQRFGFEVHSDDGKYIRATVIEIENDKPVKTMAEARSVLVTSYDAVMDDAGKISYARVYPARMRIHPAEFIKPLSPAYFIGTVPEKLPIDYVPIAIRFKKDSTPPKNAAKEVAARKPSILPGLGGPTITIPAFADFERHFKSDVTSVSSAVASVLPGAGAIHIPPSTLLEYSELIMSRFHEAMMLMHVMGRNPKMVQHETKEAGGVVRTARSKGQYSGIHRIHVDPIEFRVLVSKRAEHIREAFESPGKQGYAVSGLVLVKRHPRHLASGIVTEIPPYAKCDNEAVRLEATRLWQEAEKDPAAFDALARLIEEWGNAATREHMTKMGVYKVAMVPSRHDLNPAGLKTDRAPQ